VILDPNFYVLLSGKKESNIFKKAQFLPVTYGEKYLKKVFNSIGQTLKRFISDASVTF
jgi:hypothetical protein